MHYKEHIISHNKTLVQKKANKYSFSIDYECFNIVKRRDDLQILNSPRFQKWMHNFKKFVVLGIGGSSLGGQTICALSKQCHVDFVSNLNYCSLQKLLDSDISQCGFICVSKSGETLETIFSSVLLISELQKRGINVAEHIIVITEDKNSSLKQIANANELLCLDHPTEIGGRFSVFSLVGMVPAMLCGFDPKEIRGGAQKVLENFEQSRSNPGLDFMITCLAHNLFEHVSFIYSDRLKMFGAWLNQLYAESTGKNGVGFVPIIANGSDDQHSQLQLYCGGRRAQFFTFFIEHQPNVFECNISNLPQNFKFLEHCKNFEIFRAQCDGTISCLVETGHHVRRIDIDNLTPQSIGELFMKFMIETVGICNFWNINAFDQPDVERGKVITKQLLS